MREDFLSNDMDPLILTFNDHERSSRLEAALEALASSESFSIAAGFGAPEEEIASKLSTKNSVSLFPYDNLERITKPRFRVMENFWNIGFP